MKKEGKEEKISIETMTGIGKKKELAGKCSINMTVLNENDKVKNKNA